MVLGQLKSIFRSFFQKAIYKLESWFMKNFGCIYRKNKDIEPGENILPS